MGERSLSKHGFRAAARPGSLSLARARESNQREARPHIAPSAHPALRVRVSGRVPLKVRPCTQRNRRGPAPTLTGLIVRCRRNVKGPKGDAHPARPSKALALGASLLSLFAFRFSHRMCAALGPHHIAAAAAAMPAGAARGSRRFRGCTWMYIPRNTGRGRALFALDARKAQCAGVCFLLVTFLCTSKEKLPVRRSRAEALLCSDPLAQVASASFALNERSKWIPAFAGMTS